MAKGGGVSKRCQRLVQISIRTVWIFVLLVALLSYAAILKSFSHLRSSSASPNVSAKRVVESLLLGDLEKLSYAIRLKRKHSTKIVENSPPSGSPWPMPQYYHASNLLREIEPNSFIIDAGSIPCDIISKAVSRYQKLIFPRPNRSSYVLRYRLLRKLQIKVENSSDCGYPHQHKLNVIEREDASLEAKTPWGALRGLETFSQLVFVDDSAGKYLIQETRIVDFPRFKFRGVLLDTARHFLPLKTLKQNLDAMSYNKFNVLHWHIVDDQSWPLQLEVYPNLTDAAYHPRLVYSQEQISDLIEYARLRGIRIIPEIDSPGHSQALGKIFPEILTPCYGPGGRGTPEYPRFTAFEMLNPIIDYTYQVMENIISEIIKLFPDEYIHLGMDEVYYDCWQSNPEIAEFMFENSWTSIADVEQYYVKRTLDYVKRLGSKYMIWQDPIDNGVEAAPDTVVGIWRDSYSSNWEECISSAITKGYQVVLSAPWYLNYIGQGQDWQKYYQVEPVPLNIEETESSLIIGGEACMWGEYVDATNVISRLWPRASAVGERLWSARTVANVEEAKFRLDEHRCRMVRRQLPVQPIVNGYCGEDDWDLSS